jgi:hypothetical protein
MLLVASTLLIVHDTDCRRLVVADGNGASDFFQVAEGAELNKDIVLIVGTVLQGLINLSLDQVTIVLLQLLVASLLLLLLVGCELDRRIVQDEVSVVNLKLLSKHHDYSLI